VTRYVPIPKPAKRATGKRMRVKPQSARQRADLAYAAKVRKVVAARDEVCRLAGRLPPCSGALAWCHMEGHRRSQTRRMAPQDRHSTAWTVMLCARHAEMEERHQVTSEYLTENGADGMMAWVLPGNRLCIELDRPA
jgi:hypothetical protein